MKKISKILMILSIVFVILCPIIYNVLGSRVLADGALEEPFYLIVFMWAFVFIFLVSMVVFIMSKR